MPSARASPFHLRFVLILLAVPALALAGCVEPPVESPETVSRTYGYVGPELEEPASHDADHHQRTCMREAAELLVTARCPEDSTGIQFPPNGTLILDDVYLVPIAPSNPRSAAEQLEAHGNGGRGIPMGITGDLTGGSNLARVTYGLLPDVIVPGAGTFVAAYGYWKNLDGDGAIKLASGPLAEHENEYVSYEDRVVVGYVEPGPRPTYATYYRPGAAMPDHHYVSSDTLYSLEGGYVVFIDGSLLQTFEVTTMAEAVFSPSTVSPYAYAPGAGGRLDYDLYAAVAPGPVADLYGSSLAPLLNPVGSPNPGVCPNQCIPSPIGAGGTPLEPVLGPANGAVFARVVEEWRPGSANSAEGRRAHFEVSYNGYVDLLPRWQAIVDATWIGGYVWTPYIQMPLSARVDGRPTSPPGFFSAVAWSGLWNDADGDGWIGHAAADPYEGGSRPEPNSYLDSAGEFLPVTTSAIMNPESSSPCEGCFNVTYTPTTDWGPHGIWYWSQNHPNAFPEAGDLCLESRDVVNAYLCLIARPHSTTPIRMTMGPGSQTGGVWAAIILAAGNVAGPGQYRQTLPLWFPGGSPGFTMCTEELPIEFTTEAGELERSIVFDCDTVHPWIAAV